MSTVNTFASLFPDAEPVTTNCTPTLSVVVDTEEEFDWSAPHNRSSTATRAIRDVESGQRLFDRYGLKPCYVIDYPIASHQQDNEALRNIFQDGRCVIGTHLHPWVTPPHDEEVCARNSFPGNLDPDLEYRKLATMTQLITDNFGRAPLCYKAGRYGYGPGTTASLHQLGYRIDLSVTPAFDYSSQTGPDFSRATNLPFTYGPAGAMFELPCTGGLAGYLASSGLSLYQLANSALGLRLRLPGILARLGIVERIRLSPEGYTLQEMIRLTRSLYQRGVRHFTLSFHSPSLVEGYTPYVGNASEKKQFMDRIEGFLEFFATQLGGEMSDPETIYHQYGKLTEHER